MLIKTKRSKRSGGSIFHLILVGILSILILSVNNRGRWSAGNLFNGKNPLSVTKVVCWQSLITAGVCTEFCLMVMQDFFISKTSIFQRQFVYSGPILESGHACDFSKKRTKHLKFENIFKKCRWLHAILYNNLYYICQNVHTNSNTACI